jgi:hypothetical protein
VQRVIARGVLALCIAIVAPVVALGGPQEKKTFVLESDKPLTIAASGLDAGATYKAYLRVPADAATTLYSVAVSTPVDLDLTFVELNPDDTEANRPPLAKYSVPGFGTTILELAPGTPARKILLKIYNASPDQTTARVTFTPL